MQDNTTGRFGRYIPCEAAFQCGQCGQCGSVPDNQGLGPCAWWDESNTHRYCSPRCAEKSEAEARGMTPTDIRRQYREVPESVGYKGPNMGVVNGMPAGERGFED